MMQSKILPTLLLFSASIFSLSLTANADEIASFVSSRMKQLQAEQKLTPRTVPVTAELPADAKPGKKHFIMDLYKRPEPRQPQIVFDDLTGWTMTALGDAKVSLSITNERPIWRERVIRFNHLGGSVDTTVEIRPPAPIQIPGRFDAVNMWAHGTFEYSHTQRGQKALDVTLVLSDANKKEYLIPMGGVTGTSWTLLHGILGKQDLATAAFPMQIEALILTNCRTVHNEEFRAWFDSLAFYEQNRKPNTVWNRDGAVFPVSDKGMLPTPPAKVEDSMRMEGNVAIFTSEAADGTLELRVDPALGALNGVTARWKDGEWFNPTSGGGIKIETTGENIPADRSEVALVGKEVVLGPNNSSVVSSRKVGDKLEVTWKAAGEIGGGEFTGTYALSGRTLVADFAAKGGQSTGVALGRTEGISHLRQLRVPYLHIGYPGDPFPTIGYGGGLFISVLPDLYHSDFSHVSTPGVYPHLSKVGGTNYRPLTDGKRNELRDRILLTVSPVFAEVLPNTQNPVSPHRDKLASYMFYMMQFISGMSPEWFSTFKHYGIDHMIVCSFYETYTNQVVEEFTYRWMPHPNYRLEQIQNHIRHIRSLGFMWSECFDPIEYSPLNPLWDENKISLLPNGDWFDGWYSTFRIKTNEIKDLVTINARENKKRYNHDAIYLDALSPAFHPVDFEAGVPGAGMMRTAVLGRGDAAVEARKWYGPTFSEGEYRWIYAGLVDVEYGSITFGNPPADLPLLVEYDLRKLHPYQHAAMMGFSPGKFLGREDSQGLVADSGSGLAPIGFYKLLSASLAYGHMAMLGYGYNPPLSRVIHLYGMMQGVQKEYLTDTVADITYHNGKEWVSSSQAILDDSIKKGRLRVQYQRGLVVQVNYNASENWTVTDSAGQGHVLPPYGWLIEKPGEILSFSALVDGKRLDYTRCPDYIYMNSLGQDARYAGIDLNGAVWLKRDGVNWRAIPCANLGQWERFATPGLPVTYQGVNDTRLKDTPADKGCKLIRIHRGMLFGTEDKEVVEIIPSLEEVDQLITMEK